MGVWQRWVLQPQRLWLRRAVFQVHLWTGLILGLYIVMLSITGSLLVYRSEVDRWLGSPRPDFEEGRPTLSKDEMTAAITRALPGWTVLRQTQRVSPRFPVIQALLERDGVQESRIFDPYTGAHLGLATTPAQLQLLKVVRLHDDLLYDTDGRWWNGIGSAVVTMLVLTGAIVWWPGVSRWRRSLGVRFRGGWRRWTWDLHSAMGFWTFLFMLVWGISGFYMGVPDPFTWLVDTFSDPNVEFGQRTGDEVLRVLTRLHFGRWPNPWLKALWAVVGLAPAIMLVTGAAMWWNRTLRPKLKKVPAFDPAVN
jgi:uncharacterized iron-regulated membrane protein